MVIITVACACATLGTLMIKSTLRTATTHATTGRIGRSATRARERSDMDGPAAEHSACQRGRGARDASRRAILETVAVFFEVASDKVAATKEWHRRACHSDNTILRRPLL